MINTLARVAREKKGRQFYASCNFSSRAHTIVAITFAQKGKNEAGQMMTKTSIVNLVDLAGRYVQGF